ncbi:peroxide stress protein YaaA [Hydrogenivirga sp.]
MAFYLLPWSRAQSKMDLVRRGLSEVWKEGEGNTFPELNPLREALIRHFGVETSPLAPAYRRYKGRFWEELSFWALPSKVQKEIEERGVVFSPLFGVLGAGDLLPRYEVGWGDGYEGKTLRDFWREHLEGLLSTLFDKEVLYDFLSAEDRKVVGFPPTARRVVFEYYRKDSRVINTLPHRAYTLRYIIEMGVGTENLERINFLDYRVEEVREEESVLRVLLRSEGKYI